MLRLGGNLASEACVVVDREGIAEDLDAGAVVETRNALHEVGGWVVAEVGRNVADSEPTGKKILGEVEQRLVERCYLLRVSKKERERERERERETEREREKHTLHLICLSMYMYLTHRNQNQNSEL